MKNGRILTYLLLFFLFLDERELFAFFLRDLFDSGRARRFNFSALAHASSELRSNVRDCSPYSPCKVSCIIAIKSACFWVMPFTIPFRFLIQQGCQRYLAYNSRPFSRAAIFSAVRPLGVRAISAPNLRAGYSSRKRNGADPKTLTILTNNLFRSSCGQLVDL